MTQSRRDFLASSAAGAFVTFASMSASVGCGIFASRASALMIMPDWQ